MLKGLVKQAVKEVLEDGDTNAGKVRDLNKQIDKLEKEIRELQHKRDLEDKELKHLVRMKEEKQQIEAQKKEIDLQKQFQKKEMELQTQYHDRVMKAITEGQKKMEDIYGKILDRLPNVNMEIEKKVR